MDTKPEMPLHVQMIFKELFQGLETMKQQQWKITNYGILLLAAAFALKDKINVNALWFAVWATFLVGALMLLNLQWNRGRYRERLDGVHRAYFTHRELIDIGLSERERTTLGRMGQLKQAARGWFFAGAFISVLLIGALLISFASWESARVFSP
jgi:hypothetical protein